MGVSPMPDNEVPALKMAVLDLIGIEDHPRTVATEVMTAPNGQRIIAVMEITRGPLKVHMFKVDSSGDICRLRNGR